MAYINNTTASVSIGGVSIPGTQIKSITINEGISNGNNLTMGNSNSAEMEIELINVSKNTTNSMKKFAPVSVSITRTKITENDEDTIPFHRTWNYFYVTKAEVKRNGNTNFYNVKVTAMDAMCKLGNSNFPKQVGGSTTLGEVFEIICSSINVIGEMFRGSDIEVPWSAFEGKKSREVLETIAGYVGGYAYINEEGKLSISFLSKSLLAKKIDPSLVYLSGINFDTSSESYDPNDFDDETQEGEDGEIEGVTPQEEIEVVKLSGLICNTSGEQFRTNKTTCPIVYSNTLMDQKSLDNINSQVISKVKSYTPLSIKWVGNPTLSIGSLIEIEEFDGSKYQTYIMDRTIHYDGSLYEEIKSYKPSSQSKNLPKDIDEKRVIKMLFDEITLYIDSIHFNILPLDQRGNQLGDQSVWNYEYAYCTLNFVMDKLILRVNIVNLGANHKLEIPVPNANEREVDMKICAYQSSGYWLGNEGQPNIGTDYTVKAGSTFIVGAEGDVSAAKITITNKSKNNIYGLQLEFTFDVVSLYQEGYLKNPCLTMGTILAPYAEGDYLPYNQIGRPNGCYPYRSGGLDDTE